MSHGSYFLFTCLWRGELKEELGGDWSPENKDTGKWDLEYCWAKPRGYEKRVWRKRGSKQQTSR